MSVNLMFEIPRERLRFFIHNDNNDKQLLNAVYHLTIKGETDARKKED